nr:MAG TPA: hypothetical protein [Caudoviricetes sp.]DAX27249.1 MAG TPA: hypothetical protein [Caudoviricetes sp.]DAX94494.1 MAG TPA: hypothetical protein [Caudoviricetes sp.]
MTLKLALAKGILYFYKMQRVQSSNLLYCYR